jgi:hypothetical protein
VKPKYGYSVMPVTFRLVPPTTLRMPADFMPAIEKEEAEYAWQHYMRTDASEIRVIHDEVISGLYYVAAAIFLNKPLILARVGTDV